MHTGEDQAYPTLDTAREMTVLSVGMEHESLPDLTTEYLGQLTAHRFIQGVGGRRVEPMTEFVITEDAVFDVRTAAAVTLGRRGLHGALLTLGGVKRAASKILRETKDLQPSN